MQMSKLIRFNQFINESLIDYKNGLYEKAVFSAKSLIKIYEIQKKLGLKSPSSLYGIHSTITYSPTPVDMQPLSEIAEKAKIIGFANWEDNDNPGKVYVVALLESEFLKERHELALKSGATYTHDEYRPHITLSEYDEKVVDIEKNMKEYIGTELMIVRTVVEPLYVPSVPVAEN